MKHPVPIWTLFSPRVSKFTYSALCVNGAPKAVRINPETRTKDSLPKRSVIFYSALDSALHALSRSISASINNKQTNKLFLCRSVFVPW